MTKQYLLKVLENVSDQSFGQDAVEWAILTKRIPLTGNLQADLEHIFEPITPALSNCCGTPANGTGTNCGMCGNHAQFKPETRYDELCAEFRTVCHQNQEALENAMADSGILEEILRPIPLHGSW